MKFVSKIFIFSQIYFKNLPKFYFVKFTRTYVRPPRVWSVPSAPRASGLRPSADVQMPHSSAFSLERSPPRPFLPSAKALGLTH